MGRYDDDLNNTLAVFEYMAEEGASEESITAVVEATTQDESLSLAEKFARWVTGR